ncbi:EamA family transporter [Streptomyces sp. NPDC057806]|uniref:EamA family transporter n=1 Tax=unclassified Streptomyces TaxID=2593676 RepID=UPI0036BF5390
MGALLALASAVCYGIVDFAGGILSRRIPFTTVTLLGRLGGLLFAVGAALLVPASSIRPADVGWGALSGLGSAAAMLLLNRGLSGGAMSVVVPVSAVSSVVLSVLGGVVVLHERPAPLAWVGIALTAPALWLIAGRRRSAPGDPGTGFSDGLPASAGVATQYLALAQAAPASGLWPRAVSPPSPYCSRPRYVTCGRPCCPVPRRCSSGRARLWH